MNSEKEGRLSRWSQRKAEARTRRGGAAPDLEAEPTAHLPAATESALPADTPPPELPDVEALTTESDFSQFMQEGIPTALRKLALRKLWASDPALTELDDMLEYGEDFTDGGTLIAKLNEAADELKGDGEKVPETSAEEPAQPREDLAEAETEMDVDAGREPDLSADTGDEAAEDDETSSTT